MGVPIPSDRGQMIGECPARNTAQMTAAGIGAEGQMRDAARFPEAHRLAPIGFSADPDRHPRVDADARRITAYRFRVTM